MGKRTGRVSPTSAAGRGEWLAVSIGGDECGGPERMPMAKGLLA
jgi:hypothetical protein